MTPAKPTLSVVSPDTKVTPPPRALGPAGMALWSRIQVEFSIQDSGGIEILCLAAAALDRAESLSAAIESEGQTIITKAGIRAHPALRDELANRALVARLLQRLGVMDQPIKPPGRPPSAALGWTGDR
jgi:hypothetical protein